MNFDMKMIELGAPQVNCHCGNECGGRSVSITAREVWVGVIGSVTLSSTLTESQITVDAKVSNVPARPSQRRWSFVCSRLLKAARSFLLVDIAQTYLHSNPLFSLQGPEARSITSQGPLLLCVNIVAYMCTPYGMMNMQYSLISAVSVALRISHASAWPDPYGSWVDAYTVRNFWG